MIVIANLSNGPLPLTLTENPDLTGMINYFSGAKATIPESLKAWEYVVFTPLQKP